MLVLEYMLVLALCLVLWLWAGGTLVLVKESGMRAWWSP